MSISAHKQVPCNCQTLSGAMSAMLSIRCCRNSARFGWRLGCISLQSAASLHAVLPSIIKLHNIHISLHHFLLSSNFLFQRKFLCL